MARIPSSAEFAIPDPPPHSGADGRRLVQGLDAVLLALGDPDALGAQHRLLLDEVRKRAQGALQGLDVAGVASDMLDALRWSGVPLAVGGDVRWGRQVRQADVPTPQMVADGVLVPDPARLRRCNGVELKPLRRRLAGDFGVRLQAAPGIACYLWRNQALLVSMRDEPLAGFLHGPNTGQRHSLAWEPGELVWLRW